MKDGPTSVAIWKLKGWKNCNKFLAAHTSCSVHVQNTVLRFHLLPKAETYQFDINNTTVQTYNFYSLWVEQQSNQQQNFCAIQIDVLTKEEETSETTKYADTFSKMVFKYFKWSYTNNNIALCFLGFQKTARLKPTSHQDSIPKS